MPVAEICREAGISEATYFNGRKKYDGLLPTEIRRLKQLEDENTKLRRVVADLSLDMELPPVASAASRGRTVTPLRNVVPTTLSRRGSATSAGSERPSW